MSYNHEAVIEKLTNLTERVNTSDFHENYTDDKDLHWCKNLLSDVKDGGLVPNKEEFTMANLMWKKYSLSDSVDENDGNMWKMIDGMLTQENPTKIGAIKLYRRFTGSNLREAKDVVDAREQKLKRGW